MEQVEPIVEDNPVEELDRALATIEPIKWIRDIEGADNIELVGVRGWQCVAKKGEFQVGSLGVYFEMDSFLPTNHPAFGFLASKAITYNGRTGVRLRHTRRMKQISQGLALPVAMFHEIAGLPAKTDVSKILGITKWEPAIPAQLRGKIDGAFPTHIIPKTKQERIQNIEDFSRIIGNRFIPTIKLDGTSTTYADYKTPGCGIRKSIVCSRNWNLKRDENNALWAAAIRYGIHDAIDKIGMNIAIQGELIGEGIGTNIEKIKGCDFYVFSIWLIDEQRYTNRVEYHAILKKLADVGCVLKTCPELPEIEFGPETTVESILAMADGPSLFAKYREGLVYERADGQFSFKAISNWWLDRHN
jgi:RNA ligase (TIGR02306 family)